MPRLRSLYDPAPEDVHGRAAYPSPCMVDEALYRATYARPLEGLETCDLFHRGPLPAPWLAPGYVANVVLGGAATLRVRGRERATECA